MICRQFRPPHKGPISDTDGTDSDHDVGGLGRFSHGNIALTHQHWRVQVKCAGSFNVHCTEASEANHKTSMSLPSTRVRHLRKSYTQGEMQKYIQLNTPFEDIRDVHEFNTPPSVATTRTPGVFVTLTEITPFGPALVSMTNLASRDTQSSFIHPEVRVTRVELLDMLCLKMGLPKTLGTYGLMNILRWHLGQKLVTRHGIHYWSTDSSYNFGGDNSKQGRRDVLLFQGYVYTLFFSSI